MLPTKFTFGHYAALGSVFTNHIALEDNRLVYFELDRKSYQIVPKFFDPTNEEWNAFWVVADECGVWKWKETYHNPFILDGVMWGLELSDGTRSVVSGGSNKFPKLYKRFAKHVYLMVGKKF